jgi:dTDP-4-amino-4,6-dideoxygalactose transaminase
VGTNSRLDAVQAAVLTAKLARLDAWNEARRSVAARYHAAFAEGPARPVGEVPGAEGVYHLAVVQVPDRARVQQRLAALGVQTLIHYPIPCHRQAPYRRFADGLLPVSERAADEVLSLPMFPHLTDGQVARVCDAVHAALAGREHRVA